MSTVASIFGFFLICVALWDAFETVVLPRRVTRRFRLVRLFYRTTWPLWSGLVRRFFPVTRREGMLSYYGPISLILLLAFWAIILICGFGLLYAGQDHAIRTPEGIVSFGACLYFSGTTFFTLGLGDVQPATGLARFLIVVEAGMGFGFLAIVISYLPAIHQSFARRETNISLLDARAGSPPTAAEILLRNHFNSNIEPLSRLLQQWEGWSAELLESHLSFPMLAYFRSQHDNQSWLAALTSILDASAFVIATLEGECVRQARLTFAMGRHTLVDLALVLYAPPQEPEMDRLPAAKQRAPSSGIPGIAEASGRAAPNVRTLYPRAVRAASAAASAVDPAVKHARQLAGDCLGNEPLRKKTFLSRCCALWSVHPLPARRSGLVIINVWSRAQEEANMKQWNAVISVNEHGFKKAFDVLGGFGDVQRTEFFNVLLMRAENVEAMLEKLRERSERDPASLSFLSRLVPVTHNFIFSSAGEFETKAKKIVLDWASQLENKRFHVRIHRRGFKGRLSSPDEERWLDTLLLENLEKKGRPGHIDFEHPDAVIAIETSGTWAGLSLWTREEMERYPFARVA